MARSARQRLVVDAATSARLSKIRQRDTKPEIAVRKTLHGLGLRYRVNNRDLPGSPDVANRAKKWAVFVHGCFWHAHESCPRATLPKRNREFWVEKFRRNRERDAQAVDCLESMGYRVSTIWECEVGETEGLLCELAKLGTSQRMD